MTSVFNRRAALNFAGAGSVAALLSACAPIRTVVKHQEAESSSASSSASAGPASSSSSAASNSPSSSSSVDHKGEVKLESYDTSAGTYSPATRTQPAKNVPKPIKPKNMNENSEEGFYSSLAFMAASMQYLMTTGDSQYTEQVKLHPEEKKNYDIMVEQYSVLQTGEVWFEDPKYVITLETSSSNKSGKYYLWPATITTAVGAYLVAAGQVRDMPANERKTSSKVVMRGEYTGGVWELAGIQAFSSTVKP